ncbi:MAG TPA: DUF4270 family protein [Arenibacter sp.]|nr:DUF4270 family protein [Arenibacter sp.]
MNLRKGLALSRVVGITLVAILTACEEDITSIGSGVVGEEPFTANKAVFDVFAYNRKVDAVSTNKLPIYQVGRFKDPIYGVTEARITTQVQLSVTNPSFGKYSATVEANADSDNNDLTINENEKVKEVYLFVPYLTNVRGDRDQDGVPDVFDVDPDDPNSDSDGDGLTDIQEKNLGTDPLNPDTDGDGIKDGADSDTKPNRYPKRHDLDSIFGNREIPFKFRVERSTYFLRDLDPSTNFQEAQAYYSTQQFSPNFVSDLLFDGEVTINDKETLVFKEDDPNTEEVDESEEAPTRTPPGIKVPLNAAFFQANILDKEGSSELFNQANFMEFFRGIHLSVPDDILLLLDITQGNITIKYEYDSVTSSTDSTVKKLEKDFVLNLITKNTSGAIVGNAVNTFINDAYPTDIANSMDNGENASKIYLKGGAGSYAQIKLFDQGDAAEIINQIKRNNWIINEANLVFYVDRNTLDASGDVIEPSTVYLYKESNKGPIYNMFLESEEDFNLGKITNYDGNLYKKDGKGDRYKVRITNHINDLIVRDSANTALNLTVTSDIRSAVVRNVKLAGNKEDKLPIMSAINPLGTVLLGSENLPGGQENRKLQLEIFYTKPN